MRYMASDVDSPPAAISPRHQETSQTMLCVSQIDTDASAAEADYYLHVLAIVTFGGLVLNL